MKYRFISISALAAGALVLTACGGASSAPPAPSTAPTAASSAPASTDAHNDADVSFATGMIPHHRQAITMADMAASTGDSADVTSLARDIKQAQDPEITKMTGWLKAWGAPVPEGSMEGMDEGGGMDGMDMGGGSGMMTEDEMTSLGQATGTEFDRMWVELMIKHHEGAVSMSETEIAKGQNGEAKDLAKSIISSQKAEIDQMKSLLTKLPA